VRIAYIGPNWGTSQHRAAALRRLGHDVSIVDPWSYFGRSPWVESWIHHAGAFGIPVLIDKPVLRSVQRSSPDLVWVNQGEFLGPKLLKRLRALSVPILNYMNDDPFGGHRNGLRFRLYLKAVPYYDLLAVVREANVREAIDHGAQRVVRIHMSADEVAHRPREVTPEDRGRYGSDVAFVGTWQAERGPFMAELIRLGVPLSIWGDRWHKAREWSIIREHWRGPGVFDERYAKMILSAKVVLGLLSKDNRDLHTQRSMEIPALGAVFCAERTSEHTSLYNDGVEAVFWSTPEECAVACRRLLADEAYRESVARRGRERLQRNGHYNEKVLSGILNELVAGGVDSVR
jgi:spore maturation protein CgeB